jgi:hypothetical protein
VEIVAALFPRTTGHTVNAATGTRVSIALNPAPAAKLGCAVPARCNARPVTPACARPAVDRVTDATASIVGIVCLKTTSVVHVRNKKTMKTPSTKLKKRRLKLRRLLRRPRENRVRPRSRTRLRFSPTAWGKLLYLRDRGGTEVGGFGIAPAADLF